MNRALAIVSPPDIRAAFNVKTSVAISVSPRKRISPHSPTQNKLLSALSSDDYANLLPHLEYVFFPKGSSVYDSGIKEDYLYFMTEGVVAQVIFTENGGTLQIALDGNESVIGIAAVLGGTSLRSQTMVLSTSHAYRVRANLLINNPKQDALLHLMRRYIMAVTVQTGHGAACNRHHSIEQRLCSFILSYRDRLLSNELKLTQEEISHLMGVRREGITEAATNLRLAGLIRYCRGHAIVTDRLGLEKMACECYAVIKREYQRLLPL